MPNRPADMVGTKSGFLTVIARSGSPDTKTSRWLCKCICGNTKIVRQTCLKKLSTRSCGCKTSELVIASKRSHGMCHTNIYSRWAGMIQRCYYTKGSSYPRYGGRGIVVCKEWRESFERFYADMGDCPPGHTIERKDSNGNYEPGNCIWLPAELQGSNKTNNILIEYRGETKTLSQWARTTGLGLNTIRCRMLAGKSGEDLFRPPLASNSPIQRSKNAVAQTSHF